MFPPNLPPGLPSAGAPAAPGGPPPSPFGSASPQPDGAGAPNPLVTIPLTEEELTRWHGDIDRANSRRKVFEPSWERNLKAYAPDPTDTAWGDEVNPGVDFYQTEQKKAELFFETPMVLLTPHEGTPPPMQGQIAGWQAKVNAKLGPKQLNTERLMDKMLFSILCPSGMGCSKLGVTRVTKDVPILHPPDHPDPTLAGQPMQDGQGQPVTAPVPVYQKIFWEHFSEKKILIPTNFHDTEFDKAPWLGMKFTIPTRIAIRQYHLPPDFKGKKSQPSDQVFNLPGRDANIDNADDDQTSGVELFYCAALYDDSVYHPEHLRQLVFVDGQRDPCVHRDSPYQTFQGGVYQPDDPTNMVGNPIHIITIRDLVDSAYVPSDSTVSRPLTNELARFRTQLIEQRDSSTSVRIADEKVLTPEILAKIVRSPWGSILLVPDLDPGRIPMVELSKSTYPRESFQAQDVIERDLQKINALGSNQLGVEQNNTRSATENALIQQNSNTRQAKERNRVLNGFTEGVAKLDALMKRFELQPGEQPVSGYTYDIKPDSGIHVDAASERKFALDKYNMLAKDPLVNHGYLLAELAPTLHLDASQLITQPPPPHPEPPKMSFIIKGDDINPLAPQYANMLEALKDAGLQLTDQPITPLLVQNAALQKPLKPPPPAPRPVHPGTPPEADKVSKHSADAAPPPIPHFGGLAGQVQ